MFVQIIRDPASPPEEESIRLFYESFLITCWLASSMAQVNGLVRIARHSTEERGGVSQAH